MPLLGSLLLDSLVALALLLIIAYRYGSSRSDYFRKRGVPFVRPLPFVGNYGSVIIGWRNLHEVFGLWYKQLKKHRFGGVFVGRTPAVLVCDPEMIKMILTKDFSSLHERWGLRLQSDSPLNDNLFGVAGTRWKDLRTKLAPVFTSGKLKQMLPLMSECSEEFSQVLRGHTLAGDNVNLKEFLLRYATDVVGTCVFGIQCHSLRDPHSEFFRMSKEFFSPSLKTILRMAVFPNSKFLSKLVPAGSLFAEHTAFFLRLMIDTIKYRKENNIERNDLVQMLIQLKTNDENKKREDHPDEVIFNDQVIAAQALIFFVAGVDAVASTVGFALQHLSIDKTIQEDLADEIYSVVSQHDGQITHEGLKEMKLLDMVISETFRLYSTGSLSRLVTASSYTLPGTDFNIEKGTAIQIPLYGIHHDPDIYPDPYRFDPYRFTEEAVSKRHPFTYLPFGGGPRMCIAERFALIEIKLCLASLIRDFDFSVCSETQIPVKLKKLTFAVTPTKGFILKVKERKM